MITEREDYLRLSEESAIEGKGERAAAFKEFSDWNMLEANRIGMDIDRAVEGELANQILDRVVEENEHVTLEKVKKFLKDNGLALAGVTIMLATFVTAVMSLVKSGMRSSKFIGKKTSDAFKEIAKKLRPIVGPLFSLVESVVSLLAKGAGWLANNLWLLILFLLYLAYDYLKK